MPSNFIKILLAITGLAPALLTLYLAKLYSLHNEIIFYIDIESMTKIIDGFLTIVRIHYFLIIVLTLIGLASGIVVVARKQFSIGRIEVDSVKPVDINFVTVIMSLLPTVAKLVNPETDDFHMILALLLLATIGGFVTRDSYHLNLTLKLLLGYNHYEIQTKEKITYLMISKKQLIDRRAIKNYVKLADHMLMNVSLKS